MKHRGEREKKAKENADFHHKKSYSREHHVQRTYEQKQHERNSRLGKGLSLYAVYEI